jgi:hypothetical protein
VLSYFNTARHWVKARNTLRKLAVVKHPLNRCPPRDKSREDTFFIKLSLIAYGSGVHKIRNSFSDRYLRRFRVFNHQLSPNHGDLYDIKAISTTRVTGHRCGISIPFDLPFGRERQAVTTTQGRVYFTEDFPSWRVNQEICDCDACQQQSSKDRAGSPLGLARHSS